MPFHIGDERFKTAGSALIQQAASLARHCATAYPGTLVAGCIPPVLGSYRADLFAPAQAQPIIDILIEQQQAQVDFWLAETVSSIAEAQLIAQRILTTKKALWMAFTIEDQLSSTPCLRSGETVLEAISQLDKTQLTAILFNCSSAEVMEQALVVAKQALVEEGLAQDIHLGVYANSFSPIGLSHQANDSLCSLREDLTPAAYLEFARTWVQAGASIIGGCCGITPAHIQALTQLRQDA